MQKRYGDLKTLSEQAAFFSEKRHLSAAVKASNGRKALQEDDWSAEEFPIFELVFKGDVKGVAAQLKANASFGPKMRATFNHSLLTLAAASKNHAGSLEVVKLLFNTFKKRIKAFDVNDHSDALVIAISEENIVLANYLIQEGADATGATETSSDTLHFCKKIWICCYEDEGWHPNIRLGPECLTSAYIRT